MADKYNRVDSQFSIIGAFWAPDSHADCATGTLTSDERHLTLTTAPVYKRQLAEEDYRNLFQFGQSEIKKVIHGFTEEGICTLCQLIDVNHPGITDLRTGQSIAAIAFRVSVCLMGMYINGLEDKCLDCARYTFTSWNDWLPRYISETWEKDSVVLRVPLKAMDLVATTVGDTPIQVKIKLSSELKTPEVEGGRLSRSVAYVEVANPNPESLSWYLEMGNRLENLFSLLTGTSLAMQTMFVYRGEETAHVNMRRNSAPGTFDVQDCIRCSPTQLAKSINIWLRQGKRFHAVESLALGVLRKGKLFVETEFLSLAQALEGFHRATTSNAIENKLTVTQVRKKITALLRDENIDAALKQRICDSISHANEPTLASRLAELCSRISAETLSKMAIDPQAFVSNIVVTRNFYTHAGSGERRLRKRAPIEGKELFLLNRKMGALLRGALLLHLELPEKQLSEPLIREATRWR